jgi:arylsulfatase A-like enzyme
MRKRTIAAAILCLPGCPKDTPPPPDPKPPTVLTSAVGDASREASASARTPSIPKDANVILISIDCLRADMPWAGYPRDIAPNLTKLAERAVMYTHAYSVSSYTSMSLGGFLGGKLPSEMKRDGYFFSAYAQENLMFPEVLQSAGIHTVAGHAHGYFKDAGFSQGFDSYEVVPNLKWNQFTDENITSPDLEAIAEKLLSKNETERFFAWFHFLDPHDMYMQHEGIDWGKTARDLYDGEVTFTDRYIGTLLEFIAAKPWASRTVIIVTADHGEAFGEHGQTRHGFEVWEPVVRVPLFFVIPGVPPHKIDAARSAIDMAPTVLDLFSLAPDATFEGKSLVPEILGGPAEERDVVIDLPKTSDNDKRRALVHGQTKIISFGAQEYSQVFDLATDPDEKLPIMKGDVFDDMTTRLKAFSRALAEVPATSCKEGCLWGTHKEDAGAPKPSVPQDGGAL